MTSVCLRCIAITERVDGSDKRWSVVFQPVPINGDARSPYSSRGEFALDVFSESFARSFAVGEYYSADLQRADLPQ